MPDAHYYALNRDYYKAYAKAWAKANPQKFRSYMQKVEAKPDAKHKRRERAKRRVAALSPGVLRGHAVREGLKPTPQNLEKIRLRIVARRAARVLKAMAYGKQIGN